MIFQSVEKEPESCSCKQRISSGYC